MCEKKESKGIDKYAYEKLSNDFLLSVEEDDKNKMPWQTKNHIPTLLNSLREFYTWLDKNYWNK